MARGRGTKYPGVSRTVKHGKVVWRFRKHRNGRKVIDVYLPGPFGSSDFIAAYEAAVNESVAPPKPRHCFPVGTLGWLVETYVASQRYRELAPVSKHNLRPQLDWLRREAGKWPLNDIRQRHVQKLMDRKEGPAAANVVRKNLSTLFNFAIGLERMTHNPARGVPKRKTNPDGYHTWTEDEVAKFLARHEAGSKARRALTLMLCTGAARQDVIRLGRQNVKDGRISYSRGKTGVKADLPILPELAEELTLLTGGVMLFLTHSGDRPYKPETFANWFKDRCKEAGLPHCSSHGLRKAGAVRLAEAGATEYEIMSFLAHKTPAEAATYTKAAGRRKLADAGMAKLSPAKGSGGYGSRQATENEGES